MTGTVKDRIWKLSQADWLLFLRKQARVHLGVTSIGCFFENPRNSHRGNQIFQLRIQNRIQNNLSSSRTVSVALKVCQTIFAQSRKTA